MHTLRLCFVFLSCILQSTMATAQQSIRIPETGEQVANTAANQCLAQGLELRSDGVCHQHSFLSHCLELKRIRAEDPLVVVLRDQLGELTCTGAYRKVFNTRQIILDLRDNMDVQEFDVLQDFTQVQYLQVNNAKALSSLSFAKNWQQLYVVSLRDNPALTDLSPLAANSRLAWLDLSYTDVTNFQPLAHLPQLQFLNVTGTPLAKYPYRFKEELCPTTSDVTLRVRQFCRFTKEVGGG